MFKFELIDTTYIDDPENSYHRHHFCIYRETVTDVLYVSRDKEGSLVPMLNPKTGLPLTYKIWQDMNKK